MTANGWLATLASAAALAGCSFGPSQTPLSKIPPSSSPVPTAALTSLADRPMKLPHLAAGATCPQAKFSRPTPASGYGLGDGPVYAIGVQGLRSDPSSVTKVLWTADPIYAGPIRIRGSQLDGSRGLLFEAASGNQWTGSPVKALHTPNGVVDLVSELDFQETGTSTGAPWRYWPSFTYVETPGCYAWQVDGVSFTELIAVAVS